MKRRNKNYLSKDGNKNYCDGWERTFRNNVTENKKDVCKKCQGEGWVWSHELDHYTGEGFDDTRYSCDWCCKEDDDTNVIRSIEELEERGYSKESIDSILRGLKQAKEETKYLEKFEQFINDCESPDSKFTEVVDKDFWGLFANKYPDNSHESFRQYYEEDEDYGCPPQQIDTCFGCNNISCSKTIEAGNLCLVCGDKDCVKHVHNNDLDSYIKEREEENTGFGVIVSDALLSKESRKQTGGFGYVDAGRLLWEESNYKESNLLKEIYEWIISFIKGISFWIGLRR